MLNGGGYLVHGRFEHFWTNFVFLEHMIFKSSFFLEFFLTESAAKDLAVICMLLIKVLIGAMFRSKAFLTTKTQDPTIWPQRKFRDHQRSNV
jgi:ABC-type enterochelin transport system permease subunit